MSGAADMAFDALETWDPGPHERTFYRHHATGDRGWLVRREGKDMIRMDRVHEELRPYRESDWKRDTEARPFTVWQTAQVAFAADRQLCVFLGKHEIARKGWLDLSDAKRREWVEKGPGGDDIRTRLYDIILSVLRPLTG